MILLTKQTTGIAEALNSADMLQISARRYTESQKIAICIVRKTANDRAKARKTDRKPRNLEENTMNEQIKNYFENLRINSENDATKWSRGTLEAYWTYEFNLNHNSSEFECNELPWTTDMSDFVKTMREAGVETIAVTETSTALLENLHKLAAQGCSIEGLCTIIRLDIWDNIKEYPAIRIRLN